MLTLPLADGWDRLLLSVSTRRFQSPELAAQTRRWFLPLNLKHTCCPLLVLFLAFASLYCVFLQRPGCDLVLTVGIKDSASEGGAATPRGHGQIDSAPLSKAKYGPQSRRPRPAMTRGPHDSLQTVVSAALNTPRPHTPSPSMHGGQRFPARTDLKYSTYFLQNRD